MGRGIIKGKKLATLNLEQQQCFDKIILAIDFSIEEKTWLYFFIQGFTGIRKTFLYSVLCDHYYANEKIVLCVTSSVIISLLLPGGRISHSHLQIPINLHESSQCNISTKSELRDLLCQDILLVYDDNIVFVLKLLTGYYII